MTLEPDPFSTRVSNYRVFFIGPSGKIAGPPAIIEAGDDDIALRQARALVDGHAVELWDGSRLIRRLDPYEQN